MKRLRTLAVLLAGSLGLAFACITPAATAAHAAPDVLDYICNANGQCWYNNGLDYDISASPVTASGWYLLDTGITWEGHAMDEIVTGSGDCAFDYGSGTYVYTSYCGGPLYLDGNLFYQAASGAIVSDQTSVQEGHLYCLTAEGNGLIGNFRCPSGTPPPAGRWDLTTS